MAWQGILGHDDVVERFRRGLHRQRLASTFLFVGPAGVGKRSFAEKLAQTLLCPEAPAAELAPCGTCAACVQTASHTHPDLYIVEKPADKSFIPLSAFVGDDARRMREGLCHDIALKPFMGGRKVAIIDDADYLNEEGANCLLKTLEEPPPKSVLILIGTSPDKQLPTIRSRCQVIRFAPLAAGTVAEILLARGLAADAPQAERMAMLSAGSVERAIAAADEDLAQFRELLLQALAAGRLNGVALAQSMGAFVDAAGKEAPARRARTRQVVALAVEFYRQLLRTRSGACADCDAPLAQMVDAAARTWPGDAEAAAYCVDRCLQTQSQLDRNANQATLLECWCDDLSRIVDTGQPVAGYAE